MAELVKKSHQTVAFKASLSPNELNLLTLLIRSLKKTSTDIREQTKRDIISSGEIVPDSIDVPPDLLPSAFEFNLTELSDVMGVSKQCVSMTMKETVSRMMSRVIHWPLPCGGWEMEQLLSKSEYRENLGILKIQIHPRTKTAILDETKGVSFVDLSLFMKLKSAYAKRILDMICKFKNSRDFTLTFQKFCEIIGAEPSDYKNGLTAFRYTVLDKPLREIFKASDGVWEPLDDKGRGYELVKSGRAVKKIVFKVKYSDPELAKNISKQESLAREKLVEASNMDIAELQEMEAAILEMSQLDTFARISISGYQATSNEYGYQIPDEVMNKIKILTGK